VEYINSLGILGENTEPLLSTAIAKITGVGRIKQPISGNEFDFIDDSKSNTLLQNQMYLEKVPPELLKALK
jgi:hypothetical protein